MLAGIFGALFIGILLLGPLLWRVRIDRKLERALAVRAYAHATVVKALGGESVVSVNVAPPTFGRSGRIELSAPGDWRFLLEKASNALVATLPADYELVVKPIAVEGGVHAPVAELPRAA
jgi:hypothetical protein